MALTVLQIVQTACRRIGILAPNAAITSTDQQIIQLVGLSEAEGQSQVKRHDWQALQTEALFTTVAAELQGAVNTIAPGFKYIIDDTIWNRALRRPVYGPESQQDWQQSKAMQINGPFNSYRIMQGNLRFYPVPPAGQSCAFEYISKNWVSTSVGGTSPIWTNDADTPLLDDDLMVLGTIWRWKHAKGLEYAEDFAQYENDLMDMMGRDAGKPRLSMNGAQYDIQPAILVPAGSWGQ